MILIINSRFKLVSFSFSGVISHNITFLQKLAKVTSLDKFQRCIYYITEHWYILNYPAANKIPAIPLIEILKRNTQILLISMPMNHGAFFVKCLTFIYWSLFTFPFFMVNNLFHFIYDNIVNTCWNIDHQPLFCNPSQYPCLVVEAHLSI
jgi:hypothetical protein